MDDVNQRVFELVRRLDSLGPAPSLAGIGRALEEVALTITDVAEYVRSDRQAYHRARVVLRTDYELLVMTWLPGQASVPHDHTGSVCALQVVQGEAVEGSYCVAADGFVDLEYETIVRKGELSAGQDAGIHTVHNLAQSSETLVTVHVYAPPLKDFRRFIPRPARIGTPSSIDRAPSVVVVGGGFCGSMSAAQILRRAGQTDAKAKVAIVERRGAVAEGLAYSTREAIHLLNVPAGRMSAWPDRSDDFVQWASRRNAEVKPTDFLPRQWYGEYVRESLLNEAQAANGSEFSVVLDEVRRVTRHPAGGWMVHLSRGSSLRADAVVLAIGHRPPSDPISRVWNGPRERFIADPWQPFAMYQVNGDEPVVIVGSGLTAIDAVLSLSREKRTAPITLVSRRGQLPQAHSRTPVKAVDLRTFVESLFASADGLKASRLCQALRKMVGEHEKAGDDWRSIVDGLRPYTARLWQALSIKERRRFLRHLRPFWEIRRHRMAPSIADQLQAMLKRGEVRVIAGRVLSATANTHRIRLAIRDNSTDRVKEMEAGWVVNCTGPVPSNSAESNPVIGSLLVHNWLRADELSLGLETTATGHAIDAQGTEVPDLFVVGTLRKPHLWESTAVPELREQAAAVGEQVIKLINKHNPTAMHAG